MSFALETFLMVNEATGYFQDDFNTELNLQSSHQPTTPMISTSFEGDTATTATAKTTVNGTEYTVCTTIQYGYKPVGNSTMLVVSPQSTTATRPTKTPEEMQAEASHSGRLTTWNEFSWLYPWYRLHVVLNMNGATIDIGFSPALPDIGTRQFYFPSQFIPPIPITVDPELAREIIKNAIIGSAVEVFALAGVAAAAANTHLTAASLVGLAVYGGGLTASLLHPWALYNSGNKIEALSELIGYSINAIGAGLAGLLHFLYLESASIFIDGILFPILGAALSNLINPQQLIIPVGAATIILITSLTIALIALHFIPDPINAWFYPAFIFASFAFAITAYDLYNA